MDFENAAQRLKRDQIRGRQRRQTTKRLEISASAKLAAERSRQEQQRLIVKREKQKRHAAKMEQYYKQCEREFFFWVSVHV